MDRIKSKVIINRLLQTMSEDAQQAVSGGAIYSDPEYKYVPVRRYSYATTSSHNKEKQDDLL